MWCKWAEWDTLFRTSGVILLQGATYKQLVQTPPLRWLTRGNRGMRILPFTLTLSLPPAWDGVLGFCLCRWARQSFVCVLFWAQLYASKHFALGTKPKLAIILTFHTFDLTTTQPQYLLFHWTKTCFLSIYDIAVKTGELRESLAKFVFPPFEVMHARDVWWHCAAMIFSFFFSRNAIELSRIRKLLPLQPIVCHPKMFLETLS